MKRNPPPSLAREHEVITALADDLLARAESGDWKLCDAVWDDFARRLEAHMTLEEKELFPRFLREHPSSCPSITDLESEHGEIRAMVNRLGLVVQLQELRESHVSELVAKLKHHASLENREFYPWLANAAPELDHPADAPSSAS